MQIHNVSVSLEAAQNNAYRTCFIDEGIHVIKKKPLIGWVEEYFTKLPIASTFPCPEKHASPHSHKLTSSVSNKFYTM